MVLYINENEIQYNILEMRKVTKRSIAGSAPISVLNGFNSLSLSSPLKCHHSTATRPT